MQKYFYLYKITNILNGKYYIGVHKTKNLDDNYMGSGKYLQNAKKKYGIENFEKEILEYFDSVEEMYLREAEIVNEEFLKLEETYNLKLGGNGGWDYINKFVLKKLFKNKEWKEKFSKIMSENNKKYPRKVSEKFKYSFLCKKHSKETKEKIGKANAIHQLGEGNSQYGTCWIYSLILKQCKKIKKEELGSYLELGWNQGRKMKF